MHSHRFSYGNSRKELPQGDPYRTDEQFSQPEHADPTAFRTHAEATRDGTISSSLKDIANNARYDRHKSNTGIFESCVLALLHHFDMIWDWCPDMMHHIKQLIAGHIIPLMKGERTIALIKIPKSLKQRSSWINASENQRVQLKLNYKEQLRQYAIKCTSRTEAMKVTRIHHCCAYFVCILCVP